MKEALKEPTKTCNDSLVRFAVAYKDQLSGKVLQSRWKRLVEYHPITAKDQSRIHQFGNKVLPGLFLGYAVYARGTWKGDVLVADLEELEAMDASEIYSKRLNAKELIFPKEKTIIYFPNRRWTNQNPLEEIKTWEHPRRYGSDQFKEKVTLIFLENQKGLFHHLTTRFQMPVKQWMIFGPCQETSYTAITLNPESNFTRREKNHSLIHWNTLMYPQLLIRIWMSSKRNASMIIGISMGQEICLIHGQVSLNLHYWKKNPPEGYMWSGERLTRKQQTSRPDDLWPELWEKMGENAKLKEKQKWSHEKLHLENARKLRGIYIIDPVYSGS